MSIIIHLGLKLASLAGLALIATIQARVLHHELADCYPYKVMDLYEQALLAANIAAIVGPIFTGLISIRLLWIKSIGQFVGLLSILAGLTVPLVFFISYTTLTFPLASVPPTTEFTAEAAIHAFLHAATTNAICGFIAGVSISGLLFFPQIRAARLRA